MSTEQVDGLIGRLPKIKRLFPQWANHQIYGALASMVMEGYVAEYAESKGLFVIVPSGDTVRIRHRQDFQPKGY